MMLIGGQPLQFISNPKIWYLILICNMCMEKVSNPTASLAKVLCMSLLLSLFYTDL